MKKYNHISYLQRQFGVTLIELLVAMVISMMVLLGVVTVYVSGKRAYQFQETIVEMQENARYSFSQFTDHARTAGYLGCNPLISNLLDTAAAGYDPRLFDLQSGITGWEYTSGGGTAPGTTYTIPAVLAVAGGAGEWTDDGGNALPNAIANGLPLPGSDILILNSARPLENLIPIIPILPTDATFTVGDQGGNPIAHNVPKGAIVIVADCEKGDMFQTNDNVPTSNLFTRPINAAPLGSPDGSPGNLDPATNNFSQPITELSRIQVVRSTAFFVGLNPSGQPALFRVDFGSGMNNATRVELAEGVENMQILYGEDLTARAGLFADDNVFIPNIYVTADNVTNPDNVMSIRISLLLRTLNPLNRNPTVVNYAMTGVTAATGTTVTSPSDSLSRRVFTTTIFMRNKALARNRITN